SLSGQPTGLSINPSTGVISGTLGTITPSLGPWYDVIVTATDGTYSNSQEFEWSVAPSVAPAPPSISPIASQVDAVGDEVDFFVNGADPAGYPLTYNAPNLPDGLSIDPNTGKISGVVAEDAVGGPVVVTADDGVGEVASATFFLGVNPASLALNLTPIQVQ